MVFNNVPAFTDKNSAERPLSFSDSDLKQLKDSIKHDREIGNVLGVTISLDGKEAILARLEAAERVCKRADALGECIAEFPKDYNCWGEHINAMDDAVAAWLRAKGEGL